MQKTNNTNENPIQIIIFSDDDISSLTEQVNTWLSEHNVVVLDIQNFSKEKAYATSFPHIVVTIIYQNIKN